MPSCRPGRSPPCERSSSTGSSQSPASCAGFRVRTERSSRSVSTVPLAWQWLILVKSDVCADSSGVATMPAASGFKSIYAAVASRLSSSRIPTLL